MATDKRFSHAAGTPAAAEQNSEPASASGRAEVKSDFSVNQLRPVGPQRLELPSGLNHISWWRRLLVSVAVLLVVVTYAYCARKQVYLWPFTPHPMYKRIQGKTFGTTLVMGVGPQGEFRIKSKHISPISGGAVRAAVGKLRGAKQRMALQNMRTLYQERRELAKDLSDYPKDLLGLRIYRASWRLQADAGNKGKPQKRLIGHKLFLPEAVARQTQRESIGRASRPPYVDVAASDIVLDLGLEGRTRHDKNYIHDALAAGDSALRVRGGKPKSPVSSPKNFFELPFDAPKGEYFVWLRGRTSSSKKRDAVWIQFNKHIGTNKALRWQGKHGAGNWRSSYPAAAYAWSSSVPGKRTGRVLFKNSGKQRLRISGGGGHVVLDQVWLSTTQRELPLHTAPVRRRGGEK